MYLFEMASIDYLIRTQNGHLPVKDIEECVKGKNKLDAFSLSILSQNVATYLKIISIMLRIRKRFAHY